MRYLIVGGGAAGVEAALEIRRRKPGEEIFIIDDQDEARGSGHIFRPALKEFLSGAIEEDGLRALPQGELDKKGITIRQGRMLAIHREPRTIEMQARDGIDDVGYDRLLIATGAVPRVPDGFTDLRSKDNLFCFRTLEDARTIRSWIETHPGPCLVVGGGVLGLETAELLRIKGHDVTMLTRTPRRLFKGIPDGISDRIRSLFRSRGFRSLLIDEIAKIEADNGRITGISLKDGSSLPVETVILSAGVEPFQQAAEEAGITCSTGIHVDRNMRTSDGNIFAAGDCAFLPWSARKTLRIWEPCKRMGRVAGANMAGGNEAFDPDPGYFHSYLFGKSFGFFGFFDASEDAHHRIVSETEDSYRELVLKDGKIVGASFLGGRPFPPPFMRLMRTGEMNGLDPRDLLEDTFDQESLWYV